MIHLCGLGARPPEETTLETLQVLGGCRAVFTDVADPEVFAWLKGHCRRLARAASAAEVLREARKGGEVGLAVWGHPQFSSALARSVLAAAREAGLPVAVAGAVSPVGSVFARSVSFLGGDYGYQGIQGYELGALLEQPDLLALDLPLVVYAEDAAAADWARFHELLRSRYPAAHAVSVFPNGAGPERRVTVGAPGAAREEGAVVLVPPAT
jgi:hypothetical protein